ncbi:MAG: dynamin family protein [Lachnospiraceae bacterium]
MKKVFIKYNPYNLQTEVTVEGKKLAQNSKLGEKITPGSRFQEWVEELPDLLIDEYNDREFEITFHGTLLDYEDLTEVFTIAYEKGKLTAALERIAAKETSDKEGLIDQVFEKIQQGPFDELRDEEILNAFRLAKSSDFEVCVVATMSAGKSTLINSMLGCKLMPSKQEACTAIITRIKDTTKETKSWQAEVYDKENHMIESHKELTYPIMERLNDNENVSVIKVNGNIPFVSSEDVSLVLIDTPGPNNARNTDHKKVQTEFLSKSSKSLVLYIMEGTFGSDDDNRLLERVAESMKVGGKQSKDRFIFVVNKMDDRKKEDGDVGQTLERVRTYLESHKIYNPNLFPAAALPALNVRLISGGAEIDEDTIDETEMKVRKLNRNETLHFENYAPLPSSIRGEINNQLSEAKEKQDANAEALIHTGIISIEAAIRQYVQKYAKTAKIKNIVDTFMHKLDEVGCFEETKRELAQNRDESEKIAAQIANIRKKVDDVSAAKKFKGAIEDAVVKVNDEAKDVIDKIVQKYQKKIGKRIDKLRGEELDVDDAEDEVARLEKFAKKLEPDFQADMDELIKNSLEKTGNDLLNEYRNKLASLTEEIDLKGLSGISIEPLKLMGSSVVMADDFSIKNLIQSKQVEDGKEWVENTDKKWYKPWTWFQEKGHYRTKYKTVKYVDASELAQEFLAPIQESVYDNGDNACAYALKQSNRIAKRFEKEFKRLDGILKEKLSELESYAKDKDKAEERIRESERKLVWLETIKAEVESILEI